MIAETSTPLVVEDVDDLVMTCTVPEGQHGKPTNYTYYWTNTDSGHQQQTNNTQLTVTSTQLDATLHNGSWECKVGTYVGDSTPDGVTTTVDGK